MKILHNFDACIILKYCVSYGLDKFLNLLTVSLRFVRTNHTRKVKLITGNAIKSDLTGKL